MSIHICCSFQEYLEKVKNLKNYKVDFDGTLYWIYIQEENCFLNEDLGLLEDNLFKPIPKFTSVFI